MGGDETGVPLTAYFWGTEVVAAAALNATRQLSGCRPLIADQTDRESALEYADVAVESASPTQRPSLGCVARLEIYQ
jgi:hypothetical protein